MADKEINSKLMTVQEAITKFVKDGCRLRGGGIAVRKPMALTNEIIRQKIKNISYILSGYTEDADMLIGAGCIKNIEGSYLGLEARGLAHNYRRAVEKDIPHPIKVEEYSNFGMTMRFMAGAFGLPFMPIKSHLGSDLLKYKTIYDKKAHVLDCPFTGEKVVLLPAIKADVAIMHAQRVDTDGNVHVWGQVGEDNYGTLIGKKIIISTEEIVKPEVIKKDPNRTIIPGFRVDAIVHEPFGAHPYQCQGYYDLDTEFLQMYAKMAKERETFLEYLEKYIYSVADHKEYLKKVGLDRLEKIKAKKMMSGEVNYGY